MPVFEIGLEDGRTLQIEADDQQAALAGVEHFQQKETPSGALAGAKHGVAQVAHGIAETAKQNFGLGNGFDSRDPNYVPADPYKPSQWGQLIAENVPSMGGAIAGGKAAAAMAPGKFKIPAALMGAMGAGWLMSSGDTIKERAANNGRDEPNLQDKVVGNLTAGAASAASAVPAARLVPGLNTVAGAGGKAVAGALLKAGTTLGSGIAGGAASDLATQVGTTAGTDQGLTVDPSRLGGAAITGGVTSGAMAGAPLTGDLVRAGTLRKFAGANEAASKNYATRLEDAGNGSLGNAKVDEAAHQRVLGDLKSELGASAANVRKQVPSLSQEAENTLSALQRGEKVNPDEIARIERETASAPDGANTALLARTLHVADMAGERGGHSNRGWAGGMSGVMDKNLGFMLNPARLAGGAAATALGMHLLGTSNPLFGASLAGAYGATRIVDNLTGMRSPGKTFADHFADRNAQLRVPTQQTPAPPAPPPPSGQAQGPWGPKPPPQQSVPQVPPQQPPQPQVPVAPPLAPGQPAAAPQATAGPPVDPLVQAVMARISAQGQAAAAPPAPQVERITKAPGEAPKVKAAAAQAKAAEYEPLPDELLTRRHKTDEQVAASEVSDYEPGLQKKYAKNIMFRRSNLRDALERIATDEATSDVDSSAIGKLYHQMDHSHSRSDAQRHLSHWTSKLDPKTRAAVLRSTAHLLKLWKE